MITGRIFKIATNNPANVTVFNGIVGGVDQGIVSRPDPTILNRAVSPFFNQPWSAVYGVIDESYPEIGDVCFARLPNPTRRRIVASGMDEGIIYVYNMSGQIVQKYDPICPDDPTSPGFAPYGEMIWAVEYHAGRLFYSVYSEDLAFSGTQNQIRSVAFNPATGLLIKSTDKAEIDVPIESTWPNIGGFPRSLPVSDISFKPDGRMGLAQRSMGFNAQTNSGFLEPVISNWPFIESMVMHAVPNATTANTAGKTSVLPHSSRVLEYTCVEGRWTEGSNSNGGAVYSVGSFSIGANACGGIDYDYRTLCPDGSSAFPRAWFTGDALNLNGSVGFFAPTQSPAFFYVLYGLQGAPFTGGNYLSSILIDLNGIAGWYDKAAPGDVEIPCPPITNVIGTNRAGTLTSGINPGTAIRLGHPFSLQIRTFAGQVVHEEGGTFGENRFLEIALPDDLPTGNYKLCIKPLGYIATCAQVTVNSSGFTQNVSARFWGGDYDNDNEVGPSDFALLAKAFGSFAGEEHYMWEIDQDGDGEIGPADFAVLAANFGMFGE